MKITVTVNAEPVEVDYQKSDVGEEFKTQVPNSQPPITVNVTKYQEKVIAFDREFEITRTVSESHAGKRQFFQFDGCMYSTIEQLVHHLSSF
jgi:hypothetical protein